MFALRPKKLPSRKQGGEPAPFAFKEDKRLKTYYDLYNKSVFDNILPRDTLVGYSEQLRGYGATIAYEQDGETDHVVFKLSIKPSWHKDFRQKLLTLLHEMVHIKMYPDMRHGKKFEAEMLGLAAKGAFKGIW